jgi:nicotinamidase-related amidase
VTDRYTAPEFASIALITIDVQRDTLDGAPLEVAGTSAAIPSIKRLLDAFRATGRPIVHVVRLYREDGTDVDPCRRAAVEAGADWLLCGHQGAELAEQILPRPGIRLDATRLLTGELQPLGSQEWVGYKPRWGAFYRTQLEAHLRGLGVTTLAFCGCNFPNCPRTSIYEASERDFRIVVVRDAVSGLYERGEQELAAIGVVLLNAAELEEKLLQFEGRAPLPASGSTSVAPVWPFSQLALAAPRRQTNTRRS